MPLTCWCLSWFLCCWRRAGPGHPRVSEQQQPPCCQVHCSCRHETCCCPRLCLSDAEGPGRQGPVDPDEPLFGRQAGCPLCSLQRSWGSAVGNLLWSHLAGEMSLGRQMDMDLPNLTSSEFELGVGIKGHTSSFSSGQVFIECLLECWTLGINVSPERCGASCQGAESTRGSGLGSNHPTSEHLMTVAIPAP